METYYLSSSLLDRVRYDPEQMILEVAFLSGEIIRYAGVPRVVLEGLIVPPGGSPGRYFETHIRNAYPYERLEEGSA